MSIIKVENLSKEYRNDGVVTPVLNGINFNIEKGEFVSIMGPSGSGKSTLMHILGFLDKPTSGIYFFDNEDVSELNDDQLADKRSRKVGFIFQAFNLLPRVTVLENTMLPLMYRTMSDRLRKEKAKQLLASVGLEHRFYFTPSQLSGGEKQRVAIARALVNDPEVIFADEPTGNLDSKSGLQVMKILQSLNQQGHTIILVTHERYTAEHARRIIRLKDGEMVGDEVVANHVEANGVK